MGSVTTCSSTKDRVRGIIYNGGNRRTGEKQKIQMVRCMWLQTGLRLEQEKHH